MPTSNSNFIAACGASVDSRMRSGSAGMVRGIERLICRLREELPVFVECHSFSFLNQDAPGTLLMKMPNAELRGASPLAGAASLSNDVLGADAPERN